MASFQLDEKASETPAKKKKSVEVDMSTPSPGFWKRAEQGTPIILIWIPTTPELDGWPELGGWVRESTRKRKLLDLFMSPSAAMIPLNESKAMFTTPPETKAKKSLMKDEMFREAKPCRKKEKPKPRVPGPPVQLGDCPEFRPCLSEPLKVAQDNNRKKLTGFLKDQPDFLQDPTRQTLDALWDLVVPFSIEFVVYGFSIPMTIIQVSINQKSHSYTCICLFDGRLHVLGHLIKDMLHLFKNLSDCLKTRKKKVQKLN